jgi:hypothetical protein
LCRIIPLPSYEGSTAIQKNNKLILSECQGKLDELLIFSITCSRQFGNQTVIDVYGRKRGMESNLFKSIPCPNSLFLKIGEKLKNFP